jgi:uncharacterized membrane protein YhhN
MPVSASVFLAIAAVSAGADWVFVSDSFRSRTIEYLAKPATTVALIAMAMAIQPISTSARAWTVVALVLCLIGDIFLMLPSDAFVQGLGAFLLAHIAFIISLWLRLDTKAKLFVSVPLIAIVAAVLGSRLIRGARAKGHPELVNPLIAYIVVISIMAAVALATGNAWAGIGALLFLASDALNGWTRFVGSVPAERTLIMSTYHVALVGLVVSLVR